VIGVGRVAGWYFAAAPARYLAAVRIGIGAYALGWLAFTAAELLALADLDPSRFDPVGVVGVLGIGPLDRGVVGAILAGTVISAGLVVAGWRYRVAVPAFALGLLLLTTYQNSWGKLLHTENLLVLHALVLAVSPAADALVVGAHRRRPDSFRYGWPLRAMALATVLAYVAAGVSKLRYGGLPWMTAENLQSWVAFDLVRKELFGDPYLAAVVDALDHAWPFAVAAVFTVAVELVAPVALLGRRWARVWVTAAWLMHASVLVVMAVGFPYQLVGVAFLPVLLTSRGRTSGTAARAVGRPQASRCVSSRRDVSSRGPRGREGPFPTARSEGPNMADTPNNKDEAKGRVKEAAGNLTGDDDLKNEGKVDKAVGGVKDAADKAADKVKDVFGKD
jgi:uncharacterized protein YjbJ (UPF0337 family)